MKDNKNKNQEAFSDSQTKRVNNAIDIIDRLKGLGWKDYFDGILKIILLFLVFIVVKFMINPRPTIEYYVNLMDSVRTEEHTDRMDIRMENSPAINSYINMMRVESCMSRSYIIEFHNGNNNMANLPFYWGDMTYESVADDRIGVSDNWYNISLTRYNFILYAFKKELYAGTIDDIKLIDLKFAHKLAEDNINYIAAIPLYDDNNRIIGAVGVSTDDTDISFINNDDILNILRKYSMKINPLILGKK